jgi:hypothetical protein
MASLVGQAVIIKPWGVWWGSTITQKRMERAVKKGEPQSSGYAHKGRMFFKKKKNDEPVGTQEWKRRSTETSRCFSWTASPRPPAGRLDRWRRFQPGPGKPGAGKDRRTSVGAGRGHCVRARRRVLRDSDATAHAAMREASSMVIAARLGIPPLPHPAYSFLTGI